MVSFFMDRYSRSATVTHAMANVGVSDSFVALGACLRIIHWDRNFDAAPPGVRRRIMECDHCHEVFSLATARLAYWAEGKVFLVVADCVDQFLATYPNCRVPTQNELEDHLAERFKPLEKFGPKATSPVTAPRLKRHHDKGPTLRRSLAMCR